MTVRNQNRAKSWSCTQVRDEVRVLEKRNENMTDVRQSQVTLLGYSERGMVNSLCSDLASSPRPLELVRNLLSWCCFRFAGDHVPDLSRIAKVTYLVEQSFSAYGSLDLLILLDHFSNRRQAILLEAKVAAYGNPNQLVARELARFQAHLNDNTMNTSSLLVQLYRKMILVQRLQQQADLNQNHPVEGYLRIGQHPIVLAACDLLAEYCTDAWYVALVPDGQAAAQHALGQENFLQPHPPGELLDWLPQRCGFLTWPRIADECQNDADSWPRTLQSYAWNLGQIFAVQPVGDVPVGNLLIPEEENVQVGDVRLHGEDPVLVVWPGPQNYRVIPWPHHGSYFPESFLTAAGNLQNFVEHLGGQEVQQLLPVRHEDYLVHPDQNDNEGYQVRIVNRSWLTSRVQRVEGGQPLGPNFLVPTHWIRMPLNPASGPAA
jgi:hypothetical protein